MMVVDFNQTAISNVMLELNGRKDIELDVPLMRYMIMNSIRGYNAKFKNEYGELVIACDNHSYWRRDFFPHYKANRKKSRDDTGLDWEVIFTALNQVKEDLHVHFPYKVIDVPGAEADDVIATLAKWSQTNDFSSGTVFESDPKPFLVLSGDHDFKQLHQYKNVKQYSPVQKKFIVSERKPKDYIIEHIVRGDTGDGIPNVLSPDNSLVDGIRQKSIMTEKLEKWILDPSTMPQDDAFIKRYEQNKKLVDFSSIPKEIEELIINTYMEQPKKDRSKLLNYFIVNKMKNMLDVITEF
jgi:5'-3' exonuclease